VLHSTQIVAEMGVRGSAKIVSFSVKSEFSKVTGSETDVKVGEVHTMRFHSKIYIPLDSDLNNLPLKDGFMKDFRKLLVFMNDSYMDSACLPFRDFMNKWR